MVIGLFTLIDSAAVDGNAHTPVTNRDGARRHGTVTGKQRDIESRQQEC